MTNNFGGPSQSNEHLEQVAVVQWARLNSGRWPELSFMLAIPNGAKLPFIKTKSGKRYSPQAIKLLDEGMLPGASDLMVPGARGGYHGAWIEMKWGRNKQSEAQIEFGKAMMAFGYFYVVCWGADEAIKVIEEYMDGKLVRIV